MTIDTPLVALTLTGSLLSVLGTTFILVCYMILPQKRHIRHALIINLTIADLINAVNNSSSGLWVVIKNERLKAGNACTLNGFVGQLSIQAVDFSILIITMITMWIVTSNNSSRELSLGQIMLSCLTPWLLPVITSCIGLIEGLYVPASSNWCWLKQEPTYLRYVLTHGWRFAIIAAVLCMCIYIQIHIRRHARMMSQMVQSEEVQGWREANKRNLDEKMGYDIEMQTTTSDGSAPSSSSTRGDGHVCRCSENTFEEIVPLPPSPTPYQTKMDRLRGAITRPPPDPQNVAILRSQGKRDHQLSIQRAMLLHAYPIFWIVLWIPGIAMRITQASGGKSRFLEFAQSSTQFIGFANALTFGWNEKIGQQLQAKIRRNFGK
ncbi:uncharacterized protein L3040_005378 [Drepanopeziza brunnea f. sp. 'multigermtubi']|nr:hypothetical protein L3040_005378 [Drepanopeziza brunnea f. sp. 'multigermtubi']